MRLFYKILGSYLVVVILAIAVMGLLIAREIKGELIGRIEEDLMAQAETMTLLSRGEIERNAFALARIARARVTLIDASGRVIVDSERNAADMDNHLNRLEIQESRVKGRGKAIRHSRTFGREMLYVALPLREGPALRGYIRLGCPIFEVKKSAAHLYRSVYKTILIMALLSLFAALIFSRKITSPIRKVDVFTQKVRNGETAGTLLIESKDEIGQLAKNINYLVQEQQEKIRSADEEKRKLASAFTAMIEGVLILDSDNRIEALNNGLMNILGRRDTDLINKTPLEVFRNMELQNALERFRETGEPVLQEITLGETSPIILDVNISPIQGLSGGEEKTMMVFHEVTRLKKLERIREDFVANVTHEIKTPLTAIIGFIETLEEGAIEDRATTEKFLRIISEHAQRLNRLVDDLLTLSSIELGEIQLHPEGVSVADVVKNILPVVQAKAGEKKITIHDDIPAGLPLIMADRDRVAQVILNIVDNAVKFTPEGGRISITAVEEGRGSVVVRIADTGVGIPGSEIPRLGERFYRVDKTRSRELGGVGLGLSIVKHLMKAHQGRVEIESSPGKGTTVSLYFPISR
ncbi:MAG: ATP-binding protein [Syntrophales bacterium]|nr:ATP-binding protein [Syntrophales bacterium]